MDALGSVQWVITWVLSIGTLALAAFAFVDALRVRADAYPATNNQTKVLWLVLLGSGVGLAVLGTPGFGLLNLIAIGVAGIYFARVRPPIREILGGSSGGGYRGR